MYKCLDCGARFQKAKALKESHGEVRYHCPMCGSEEFFDEMDLKCDTCGEVMESPNEIYCEECKLATRQIVMDAVAEASAKTGLNLTVTQDHFEDIFRDETSWSNIEVEAVFGAIISLADDRRCGIISALGMVEEFVQGGKFMVMVDRR